MQFEQAEIILRTALSKLKSISIEQFGNRFYIIVPLSNIIKVCEILKSEIGCEFSTLSGYKDDDDYIVLIYALFKRNGLIINIKCNLDDRSKKLNSVSGIFPEASWAENEVSSKLGLRIFHKKKPIEQDVIPFYDLDEENGL